MTDLTPPAHLTALRQTWQADPRAASRQWFSQVRFGLFVHYALCSLIPRGKSGLLDRVGGRRDLVSLMEAPPKELADAPIAPQDRALCLKVKLGLLNGFTAERFDAEAFCDLAEAAGMRYVTFTTKHLGGLYMFDTSVSEFKAPNSPAARDLVREMTEACARRGLGYFHYVPPHVARTDGEHFERNNTILRELLTNYGPVAGIWFDGIGGYNRAPENYGRLSEKFAMIREFQPHALISFKEGAIGEEDFVTPEHFLLPHSVQWDTPARQGRWQARLERWHRTYMPERVALLDGKPREINTVMQECAGRDDAGSHGGWINDEDARHLSAEEVWFQLSVARHLDANLLMNIGPRGDGSIHPDDERVLRETGEGLRERGWPSSAPPG
jgi:alpha-L-fucosidase